MATTPEGAVKKRVREVLRSHPDVWHWMPVVSGYGEPSLDFLCAVRIRNLAAMFAIETKAPGKKPTPRQEMTIAKMDAVGVKVFVIDGEEGINELKNWLTQLEYLRDGSRC